MVSHPLWSILSRALDSQISSLGTTYLAVALGALIWLIVETVKLFFLASKVGWSAVFRDWRSRAKEALIGVGVTAFLWICLFAVNVNATIKADYARLDSLEADNVAYKREADRVPGLEEQVRDLKNELDGAGRKKRLEIRTKLGHFLLQANTIRGLCLTTPPLKGFNCEAQINKLLGDTLLYIDKNLESSYRARFEAATGVYLGYVNAASPEDNNSINVLKFKTDILEEFIREFRD